MGVERDAVSWLPVGWALLHLAKPRHARPLILGWSDSQGQLVEGGRHPQCRRFGNTDSVVAATDVLDERVPGDDDPGSVIRFQAAHRPQAPLQLPVIGFHSVVGVELRAVPGTRGQLIKNMRVHRRLVSDDLHRDDFRGGQRPGEETPGSLADHRAERGEFVRQLLEAAGIQPAHGPQDGPYLWERPAPADPDVPPRPVLLLKAVAERQRWKAEYTAAQLANGDPPPNTNCSATDDQAA